MSETMLTVILALVKCVFSLAFVMQIVPLLIWAERKGAAYIQDRPGPNRAHILGVRAGGLIHTLPDVFKLITKEDVVPSHVFRPLWALAPIISMSVALVTFSVVPWGDQILIPAEIAEKYLGTTGPLAVNLQVADIDGGLLYVLAMTSLGVYGIMLAGWSSNNKFSLIGGLRSAAQMVSYELAMGMGVVAMFMTYGTTRLDTIMQIQSESILNWGVLLSPPVGLVAFILFWVSAFAECNRNPFDLPEGEAELVAGYHTEYSSLRFALFFMAEYANMVVASSVTATLFFGGYNIPFVNGAMLREHIDLVLIAIGVGGGVFFLFAASIAFGRRKDPFYAAMEAFKGPRPNKLAPVGGLNGLLYRALHDDTLRQHEWKIFTAIWAGAAAAHFGLIGLGAMNIASGMPLLTEIIVFVTQLNAFVVKVLFGCWMFIWVRWTLPRFRYDQLMDLGWKYMLPIGLVNILLAAVWLLIDANTMRLYAAIP
ncbi:MAG: NADH-quinone oxidoreductase subunit H [Deltaproteobacteria bacterium]|nr:NADH-quinone oxidoreductase subunit H [Deltaproteobacteria bacterium]MBK9645859.1 NADH-quinone oxidoreductase subunit H [Deltaproteobacteria bacterium]